VDLVDFFLGDSRVFLGDLGDLALGDSLFFLGDFVDLALAALAFLGDVASFLGLDSVVDFLAVVVEDVDVFLATGFFVVAFFEGDFLGDFVGVVDDFLELDVDLFFGEDGAVEDDPDPDVTVVVEVDVFLVADFFLATLFLDPGASL